MTALPRWAAWNSAGAERPWTVGIEEEVMLLQPPAWALANRIDDVLDELPANVRTRATAETHACVVELASIPHATVGGAVADHANQRRALQAAVARLGLAAAVSGTHPTAVWSDVEISRAPRYRQIHTSMRELAHREPTCALHVHVAVPSGEVAVRVLGALRADLPLLLALSGNSPFWQGRDTGLASARTPIFSMFPRVGIPRRFSSYAAYAGAIDKLVTAGAVPDPSFLWWDARLQPRFGTVEVRIMDAQTRLPDTAALAALVQSLVRLYAEGDQPRGTPTPEVLAENRFIAARDGMAARFVAHSGTRAAQEWLADRLDRCVAVARELGATAELAQLDALAADGPHLRQRAVAGRLGVDGLVAELSARFTRATPAALFV
jgi:carboxylate-amine ligase